MGTKRYYETYDVITSMLRGETLLSLKDAVFAVEQAYLGDQLQQEWYENEITHTIEIIQHEMRRLGYSDDNVLAKKMLLHAFMSGSLRVHDESGSGSTTPKRYDFEDIYGKTDWTKMFVTKLIRTHTGQCHSLPLLYLILAEELQIDACLAFSPEHSYIMLKDADDNWCNLELTNGHYTSDLWLLSSGLVKSEAIGSGIYMRPLNREETLAQCLVDLAQGYIRKYGWDDFVLQCTEKALEYHPKNIFALQLLSDYHVHLFHFVVRQLGEPPVDQLPEFPKAYQMYTTCYELQQHIKTLGYEPMPEELYKQWLMSLTHKKELQAQIIRP